jgi:transposase
VIDSQSVKADAVVGAGSRGFDGGKLVNGRKRHVVVDTLGLLLGVMVTAGDVGDRAATNVLLEQVVAAHHRLALVWADGGHTGSLVEHCLATFALVVAIVKRSDNAKGFVVLSKRWIVERLFAHLMRSRRLVRDFERRIASAEAMICWNDMHALRHFYAPVLLDAGENIKALAEYLGHSDPGLTLRVYAHLMPSSRQRTRKAVAAVFEGAYAPVR